MTFLNMIFFTLFYFFLVFLELWIILNILSITSLRWTFSRVMINQLTYFYGFVCVLMYIISETLSHLNTLTMLQMFSNNNGFIYLSLKSNLKVTIVMIFLNYIYSHLLRHLNCQDFFHMTTSLKCSLEWH